MLDQITPIIITYNEAPNIGRALEKLHWAKDIVIIDSFSNDETLSIIAKFPGVRVFQRNFDCPANQFNFALKETGITSEWVLTLGADYILTDNFIRELEKLVPKPNMDGYYCHFLYCIFGLPLRGSVYPPRVSLFRKTKAYYRQDGHTEQLIINGKVDDLQSCIMHDDRKSLSRWIIAQDGYAKLEADKLIALDSHHLNWPDRVRKMRIIAPPAIFFYCLLFGC